MVEYSTHNGSVTGSSPVRPIMKIKKHITLKKTKIIYPDNSSITLPTVYKHKNFVLITDIFQKEFFKNTKIINMKG